MINLLIIDYDTHEETFEISHFLIINYVLVNNAIVTMDIQHSLEKIIYDEDLR